VTRIFRHASRPLQAVNNESEPSCFHSSMVHGRLTAKRPRWL
jgi:hypothetical protein